MELLSRPFLGIPLWGWLAIAGIGIAAAVFLLPRFFGGTASLGSGPAGNQATQPADPNIDPNTGVPYQVEQAINPNTGLPAYFDLFGQQQGNTTAAAGKGAGSTTTTGGTTSSGAGTATTTSASSSKPVVTNAPATGQRVATDIRSGHGPYGQEYKQPASDWAIINNYNPQNRGRQGGSPFPVNAPF